MFEAKTQVVRLIWELEGPFAAGTSFATPNGYRSGMIQDENTYEWNEPICYAR